VSSQYGRGGGRMTASCGAVSDRTLEAHVVRVHPCAALVACHGQRPLAPVPGCGAVSCSGGHAGASRGTSRRTQHKVLGCDPCDAGVRGAHT